jgi:hypothetical protein
LEQFGVFSRRGVQPKSSRLGLQHGAPDDRSLGTFVGPEKHPFEHSDRVHPVYLSYGFKKIDNINIQSPKGWSVGVLPKPIHEDAKAVEFSHRMGDLAGNLNIRGEVRCDLMLVPRTNMECLEAFTRP